MVPAAALALAALALLVLVLIRLRRPSAARRGDRAPVAVLGLEAVPVLGALIRLWWIVYDPTGLVERCAKKYGPVFCLRIPFHFSITYALGGEGYRALASVRPGDGGGAAFGAVMRRVPTIGFWYSGGGMDDARLQELLLACRAYLRDVILTPRAVDAMEASIRRTAARHLASWLGAAGDAEVDLSAALVGMVHDAAGRCVAGDALWDAIGAEAAPLLDRIVRGVDIPRTTACGLPSVLGATRERRATERLRSLLDGAIAAHRRGEAAFPIVDGLAALGAVRDDADLSWALMNILWHGLNYSGSYFFWSFAEAVEHERTGGAIAAEADGARRTALCWNAARETLRLHPVSSLVRLNEAEERTLSVGGRTFSIAAGEFLGTTPAHLTRDARRYSRPEVYDPARYDRGEATPSGVFGRGAFGCVAQRFVRVLFVSLMDEVLGSCEVELHRELPRRRCRVHLTYPDAPVHATVRRRARRRCCPVTVGSWGGGGVCPVTGLAA